MSHTATMVGPDTTKRKCGPGFERPAARIVPPASDGNLPEQMKSRSRRPSLGSSGRSALYLGHITHGAGIGRGGKCGIGSARRQTHSALRSTGFHAIAPLASIAARRRASSSSATASWMLR